MTRDINNDYFIWLCSLINDSKKGVYNKLLLYLHNVEFVYIIPMDSNRYADGVNLRYRFGRENNIDDPVIASCLDNRYCSVLEMLVALAVRCETSIMVDPDNGFLPGRWFWDMIHNLGLDELTDRKFDSEMANSIIYRFLNREYGPNGEGSIVYLPDCPYDIRSMEIWYQMMRYLTQYRRNGME